MKARIKATGEETEALKVIVSTEGDIKNVYLNVDYNPINGFLPDEVEIFEDPELIKAIEELKQMY